MFNDCTSLEKCPDLPAKSLASYCYRNMFGGCKNIKTGPKMPLEITLTLINCF